jgi:hypothetical protein
MVRIAQVAAIALGLLSANMCSAGIYSDSLARCLVSHTSNDDKTLLVRWIFAIMALHPAVSDTIAVNDSEREKLNRSAGGLFERLLTDDCRKETKEALMYEGPMAMQTSFQVLGQVATRGLMTDPAVAAGLTGFQKYLDETKLRELSRPDPVTEK